jgi:hypothetical protein
MTIVIIDMDAAVTNGTRHSLGCSMQQEWPSSSIMTSRRRTQTVGRLRCFPVLALCVFLGAHLLQGCAALPEDAPVMEQLDDETGITVARLGKPMELYRETFQRDPSGRFAFLAPFETNQMGNRELYLWLALPVDPAAGNDPVVEVNGATIPLGTPGREADFVGLRKSPYRIPTPWSAMYYYKIDAALIARLAEANELTIRVVENIKDGTVKTVFSAKVIDSRLKEFGSR